MPTDPARNIIQNIVMADDSVLFVATSKAGLDVHHVYSRTGSLQFIHGNVSDLMLQEGARIDLLPTAEGFPESTNLSENIFLEDHQVMLLLSSKLPLNISNVSGGSGSCLILGHLSEKSIECLMKLCGLRHQPTEAGMYKVILQPEHYTRIQKRFWHLVGFLRLFSMLMGQICLPEDVIPAPNPGLSPQTIAAIPKLQDRPSASDTPCAICLEEMGSSSSLLVLQCDHYFHEPCLSSWLSISNTCPLCKSPAVNLLSPSPPSVALMQGLQHHDEQSHILHSYVREAEEQHGATVGPAALGPSLGISVGRRIHRFGYRVIRAFLPFSNP